MAQINYTSIIYYQSKRLHHYCGVDTHNKIQNISKIQNEAACIISGLARSVSFVQIYNECGWDISKIVFGVKVNYGMIPAYIVDLFPPLVCKISG